MHTGMGAHADEELLERYSMGTLPEPDLARFEEHLLVCSHCQDRLNEMDGFLAAFRTVAPGLRVQAAAEHPWKRWFSTPAFPRFALAGSLALLVLAFLVGRVWNVRPGGELTPATVVLQLARGPESGGVSEAPAARPLTLEADVTQLPEAAAYGVEVVDTANKRMFYTEAKASQGKLRVSISRTLDPGSYYVRLYSPSEELLREFGLQVR